MIISGYFSTAPKLFCMVPEVMRTIVALKTHMKNLREPSAMNLGMHLEYSQVHWMSLEELLNGKTWLNTSCKILLDFSRRNRNVISLPCTS
jgi:hypothetical protein